MKLKELIINIIYMLLSIPLYYLTKGTNLLPLTLSIYLYLILSSIFNHIDNYDYVKDYYDKNYTYSINIVYKYTNISIILINIIITILISILTYLLNKLFNIDNLILINIALSLTLFIKPVLRNISNICSIYKFKTLKDNIFNIYNILNIIFILLTIILGRKLFPNKTYIFIILIYLSSIISFILVYILCKSMVLKDKVKKKQFKKTIERTDYKKIILNIINRNIVISIKDIVYYSYNYIGLVILYFVLKNRYGYSYDSVSNILTNYFLYGYSIINIFILLIKYHIVDKINDINKNLKDTNIIIEDYLINISKFIITLVIILSITSRSIYNLIYTSNEGYILHMLSINMIFNILYYIVVNIFINNIKNKKIYIIMSLGILLKLILIVPLINSIYRMGYNMIYGDILINTISYIFVITLLFITGKNKYKVDFTKKFDKILDIIYYNIILCSILLLISLVIPIKVSSKLDSLKVILIYSVISILYIYLRKKMKTNERIIIKNKN